MLCSVTYAEPPSTYSVMPPIHVGGEGRWDYASVDAASHRLYFTRSNHAQAVDLATGKVVLDVKGLQRTHGIVAVPAVGRGYITDGEAKSIVVFDLKTGEVLANVPAADDADGEIYDPGTNKVLATCGDAGVMAVLDAGADPKTAKPTPSTWAASPSSLPPTARAWRSPTWKIKVNWLPSISSR